METKAHCIASCSVKGRRATLGEGLEGGVHVLKDGGGFIDRQRLDKGREEEGPAVVEFPGKVIAGVQGGKCTAGQLFGKQVVQATLTAVGK